MGHRRLQWDTEDQGGDQGCDGPRGRASPAGWAGGHGGSLALDGEKWAATDGEWKGPGGGRGRAADGEKWGRNGRGTCRLRENPRVLSSKCQKGSDDAVVARRDRSGDEVLHGLRDSDVAQPLNELLQRKGPRFRVAAARGVRLVFVTPAQRNPRGEHALRVKTRRRDHWGGDASTPGRASSPQSAPGRGASSSSALSSSMGTGAAHLT